MVLGASNNLFTIRVVTDKVETMIPKGEQPASADKGTNARMMLDAASEGTGRLQQTSSSAEGRWILALGATIVLATVVVMGEESWLDSWTGIATVVAVNFLGLFVLWRRRQVVQYDRGISPSPYGSLQHGLGWQLQFPHRYLKG